MLPTFRDSPSKRFSSQNPAWGWGWPCCCQQQSVTACSPSCASVGHPVAGTSTGTLSGTECTDCTTQVIYDDFSSMFGSASITGLDPAWIGCSGCAGNVIGSPSGPHIRSVGTSSGGAVVDFGSGACMVRPFARPPLAGLCIQVKARIVRIANGTGGIVMGYGRSMFARTVAANYGVQSCIDANGCIDAAHTTFSTFGALAQGDTISFIFKDEGAGPAADGSLECTVCYLVNGVAQRTERGVLTCFPSTMYAGLQADSGSNTQFDLFEVRTN